jgi:hypothetical protein
MQKKQPKMPAIPKEVVERSGHKGNRKKLGGYAPTQSRLREKTLFLMKSNTSSTPI